MSDVILELSEIGRQVGAIRESVDGLVYEQHTANLIAALGNFDPQGQPLLSADQIRIAVDRVVERLGLTP